MRCAQYSSAFGFPSILTRLDAVKPLMMVGVSCMAHEATKCQLGTVTKG